MRYHWIGYAGSSRIAAPVSLGDQVGHLRALMRHLGIERAHFVGHSSSGNIVLQAALDATHLLHVENPRGMAEGLVTFFARHALSVQ